MAYYDFPHTRNYDTDLGYLIEKTKENTSDISSLEDKVDNINVDGIKEDIVELKAKDISLESEINSNTSNIKSNKSDILSLQNANYLKLVNILDSANITVDDRGKVNGVQTFQLTVTGSTPSNLTANTSFFNNNPATPILTNIIARLNSDSNTIDLEIIGYSNGKYETSTKSLELNSDEFNIIDNKLLLKKEYLAKGSTTLADGTSIDEVLDNGFYHQEGDWSGTLPDIEGVEWHYSNLLCFNGGSDVVTQMLFHFATSSFSIRTGRGSPVTWQPWAIYNTSTEELGINFTNTIADLNKTIATNAANINENKALINSILEPSYNFNEIAGNTTSDGINGTWSATANGYVLAKCSYNSSKTTVNIIGYGINVNSFDIAVCNLTVQGTLDWISSPLIPVKKGDIIKYSGTGTATHFYFSPYQ